MRKHIDPPAHHDCAVRPYGHDLVNVIPGAFCPPVGVKTNLVPPSSEILPTRGGPSC